MHLLLESLDYTFEIDRRDRALSIGRLSDCDYIVLDSFISRKHSEVEFKKGNWIIRDLGSKYGTIINNKSIGSKKEQRLNHGDLIKLGAQTFKVSLVKDQSSKPVAKLEVKAKNKEKPAPQIPDDEPTPKTPAPGVGAVEVKDGEKARAEDVIAHLAKSKTKKELDSAKEKEEGGEQETIFHTGPSTAVLSAPGTAVKRKASSPALEPPTLTGPVIQGKERRGTKQAVKRRTIIQTEAERNALLPKEDKSKVVLACVFGVIMIGGVIAYAVYGGKTHPKAPETPMVAGKTDEKAAHATDAKAADAKPAEAKTEVAAAATPAATDAPANTTPAEKKEEAAAAPAAEAKPAEEKKADAPTEEKKPDAPAAETKPADTPKPAELP